MGERAEPTARTERAPARATTAGEPVPRQRSRRKREPAWIRWLFANRGGVRIGIVAVTLLVYARTLGNGFIDFDDPENIIDNFSIRDLTLANIGHYFTEPLQFMYTPLVTLSYAVDYQLWGLAPAGYHATNLALHLVNVVLVELVVFELTRRAFLSLAVTAAFAVHPMNVDGIAWVATRSNLLATAFSLGAILVYLRYSNAPSIRRLAVSVALFVLAVFSKSAAVVLPVTLVLVDLYRGRSYVHARRPVWRPILEKVPYLVVALAMGFVAIALRVDEVNPFSYTAVDRFFLICSAVVTYLAQLVVPADLAFARAYPAKTGAWLPWYIYLAPVVLALVGAALWRLKSSRPLVLFGAGFFLVNVVLSQFVLLIDNYAASRYVYLPSVGLFLILADLAERGLRRADPAWLKPAVAAAVAVGLLAFAVATIVRAGTWRDTVSIMSDSIRKEPGVAFVHNSRGIALYKAGDYDAALADFDATIELDPEFKLSLYYRGLIRHLRGDYAGALADFDVVVATYPGFAAAFDERGRTRVALKDTAGALADFTAAITLDPYRVYAYNNRGLVHLEAGDAAAAEADFTAAVGIDPGFADGYRNRAKARESRGDRAGACSDWTRAGELGHPEAPAALATDCG
jgi:tetratricopeptide (TPR) repeat protein